METSSCIIDGLYLGGILAALNEKDLADKSITHILSIDESPLPPILSQKFNYKHIYALDVCDTDLLSSFADTFVFIEQARNTGGIVLVHCQAGMSRSATVVAAYLMQKMSIDRDKALDIIKSSRPFIRPNEAFLEQLELFESMGCQLLTADRNYRAFKLTKLAEKFQHGASDCEIPSNLFVQSDFAAESNDAYYKCRKCRLILFRHGAVTRHVSGAGEAAFDWRGKGSSKQSLSVLQGDQEACTRSLFVDPLQWMKGKINVISGKLHCPKCDIKLGSFVWYGEKCPCGAWVAPAFHIDTGKVDKIPFQTVSPQTHVSTGVASPHPTMGRAFALRGPQGGSRPLSVLSDHLVPQRPLQGMGVPPAESSGDLSSSSSSLSHHAPPHQSSCHSARGTKPVAFVAAIAPRVAVASPVRDGNVVRVGGPSPGEATASLSSSSFSSYSSVGGTGGTAMSGMEIDELSYAVGTSSLGGGGGGDVSGSMGMEVDS